MADSGIFFMGVHKGVSADHSQIRVNFPPATQPKPVASFVYAPFNKREFAICLAPDHKDFESSGCLASNPTPTATPTKPYRAKCVWNIHCKEDDVKISAGAGVYDTAGLCPQFF